jgi:hypothetical protein
VLSLTVGSEEVSCSAVESFATSLFLEAGIAALGSLLMIGLIPVVLVLSLSDLWILVPCREAGVGGSEASLPISDLSKAWFTADVNPREGSLRRVRSSAVLRDSAVGPLGVVSDVSGVGFSVPSAFDCDKKSIPNPDIRLKFGNCGLVD